MSCNCLKCLGEREHPNPYGELRIEIKTPFDPPNPHKNCVPREVADRMIKHVYHHGDCLWIETAGLSVCNCGWDQIMADYVPYCKSVEDRGEEKV